ncbi:MAG TPA: chaperone modulator CbpM [Acidimicrobiales bacterium]|jgi:DNA-binding transcriptional MerR regulator|nr:chaperone modulator CbpM [Acidimicrobiales bacterium]
MTVALVPVPTRWLSTESFAQAAGLHPELVRRFVSLGLLEASQDASGALQFSPRDLATVARIRRLRAGLSINYTAVGVIIDLLDRIAELEAALQRSHPVGGRP